MTLVKRVVTVPEPPCIGVRCHLGQCIAPIDICDGIPHCEEGTDENHYNCEYKKEFCQKTPYDPSCGKLP